MTDAASECRRRAEPAACMEERLRTHGQPGHLLLTSSREWEGNGVSHDARKDVKLTADAGASILILISQRWQVSADSVM